MNPPTLVILNPYAGNGKIFRQWPQIEPYLIAQFGKLEVIETHNPENVPPAINQAYQSGIHRVFCVGGDGTNFEAINALARLKRDDPDREPMIFGTLPAGTGRDWAKSRGIPMNPMQAVKWLKSATPTPIDLGRLEIDHDSTNPTYFLNIATTGISGDVNRRIYEVRQKKSWSFLKATIESIISYKSQLLSVRLDGETWFDQKLKLVVVANSTTFGHGMRIAPNAKLDDGLFDVVVLEDMPRLRMLRKLWHVYNASHLKESGVYCRQARSVEIGSPDDTLHIDLDGELRIGRHLKFTVEPRALHVLI